MSELRIFDTHCHLNMSPLVENWREYWKEAQTLGVKKAVVVGANMESSQRAIEIAEADKDLRAAIGIHPTDFYENDEGREITADLKKQILEKMIEEVEEMRYWRSPKIVAIGECGLEYYQIKERSDFEQIQEIQRRLLTWQINLGLTEHKTLIFHLRDESEQVFEEILQMIKLIGDETNMILHCIGGSAEFVKRALKSPRIYVSFAGNVTFKNAKNLQELVPLVPKNRILIETDAPFLSPVPHRGKFPCEPKFIIDTAEFLRDKFKVDLEQTYQNSLEVFNL